MLDPDQELGDPEERERVRESGPRAPSGRLWADYEEEAMMSAEGMDCYGSLEED